MQTGIVAQLNTKTRPMKGAFLIIRRRATLPGPGWVQVPSLLVGLTSVFGMGTGVSPPLGPPVLITHIAHHRTRIMGEQNRWLSGNVTRDVCYVLREFLNQYTMRTRHDCLHYSAHTSTFLLAITWMAEALDD